MRPAKILNDSVLAAIVKVYSVEAVEAHRSVADDTDSPRGGIQHSKLSEIFPYRQSGNFKDLLPLL